MKRIGILFQADMVRAILAGRKTLTSRLRGLDKLNDGYHRERINKVQCRDGLWCFWEIGHGSSSLPVFTARSPYGQLVGDVLVGRETFYCDDYRYPNIPESERTDPDWRQQMLYYRADGEDLCQQIPECDCTETKGCWIPSQLMPYWASRLRLPVVRVWPSRLQDMDEEMAMQEGVEWEGTAGLARFTAKKLYAELWDRINGKKSGRSWASNPWVWRVQFIGAA
jgi:hypothetical protein